MAGAITDPGPRFFLSPEAHHQCAGNDSGKISECEVIFRDGISVSEVSKRLDLEESTLRKAIMRGAVCRSLNEKNAAGIQENGRTKTERSRADAMAASGIGTACTRPEERIIAAIGMAGSATARFEHSQDVAMVGLLTGFPALC